MEHKMFTIKDTKGGNYFTPIYQKNHADAERFLMTILKTPAKELPGHYANVSNYPEDFDLYFIGTYDDISGKVSSLDSPQHITKAINLKS